MRIAEGTIAIALVLVFAGCAGGRYEAPASRYEVDTGGGTFEPDKQWREGEVRIPAYPDIRDLQEFSIKGQTDNRFFVDSKSLSVDPDGVIRFALIVRSNTGAENIAYEGIRCETREWKPYAFGRSDRTWSAARDPQWQRIVWRSTNAFRFVLYRDYFCPDGYQLRDAGAVMAALRRKGSDKDRNR